MTEGGKDDRDGTSMAPATSSGYISQPNWGEYLSRSTMTTPRAGMANPEIFILRTLSVFRQLCIIKMQAVL